MAGKRVIWSSKANQELIQILDYFNKRNGSTAYSQKLLNHIEISLTTLLKSEFIGRLTSNKRTRVLVLNNYLIFYESGEKTINVLSFWDNRQNPKKRIVH